MNRLRLSLFICGLGWLLILSVFAFSQTPISNNVLAQSDPTPQPSESVEHPVISVENAAYVAQLGESLIHTQLVADVAWSPDGTMLASIAGTDIQISNAMTGDLLHLLSHEYLSAMAWSPDGTLLASGGVFTIRLWDTGTGELVREIELEEGTGIRGLAWSPDSMLLASAGTDDYIVQIWDVMTGELSKVLEGARPQSITWSPDGARIAVGGYLDETVWVWDVVTGELVHTLKRKIYSQNRSLDSISWSPDNTMLASGAADDSVWIWDAASGEILHKLEMYGSRIDWSPSGTLLAIGNRAGEVLLWDVANDDILQTLNHTGYITCVAWSTNGTLLASGSADQTVRLWAVGPDLAEVEQGSLTETDQASLAPVIASPLPTINEANATNVAQFGIPIVFSQAVTEITWSPDSTMLASIIGTKNEVQLWDVTTRNVVCSLRHYYVNSVAWSPDGTLLATGNFMDTIRLWDPIACEMLREIELDIGVNDLIWSPDSTMLALSNWSDYVVQIWNIASGELSITLEGARPDQIAWSPDGTRIAAGGYLDETVSIWDIATGELLHTLDRTIQGQNRAINSIFWSSDGTMLASGSGDNSVWIWDATTGEIVHQWENIGYIVTRSPDGTLLASGAGKEARLWNAATGELLHVLGEHPDRIQNIAWSPNGTMIATAANDKTVKLWAVVPETTSTEILPTVTPIATTSPDVIASTSNEFIGIGTSLSTSIGAVEIVDIAVADRIPPTCDPNADQFSTDICGPIANEGYQFLFIMMRSISDDAGGGFSDIPDDVYILADDGSPYFAAGVSSASYFAGDDASKQGFAVFFAVPTPSQSYTLVWSDNPQINLVGE